MTPAQKKHILLARAQVLARDDDRHRVQEESLRIVEFLLGQDKYAVEATYVRAVYQLTHLTPLPCTPPFVLGIVNVRGRMLSVLDLQEFFGLPHGRSPGRHSVVILRTEDMEVGILTDGILGARVLPLSAIQSPPPSLTGVSAEYFRGVTSDQLVILDAETLLSDQSLIVGGDEMEI